MDGAHFCATNDVAPLGYFESMRHPDVAAASPLASKSDAEQRGFMKEKWLDMKFVVARVEATFSLILLLLLLLLMMMMMMMMMMMKCDYVIYDICVLLFTPPSDKVCVLLTLIPI